MALTLGVIITGIIGSTSTFFVSHHLRQGPVRSSAGLSLLVALLFHYLPMPVSQELSATIPYVFIGASFIGMVSAEVLSHFILMGLAGGIFGFLYLHASHFFTGFGGGLGTAACIALMVSLGGLALWERIKKR
ncbi:hypothetical protein AB9P05_17920 [Roseivirga sp. BDSF3-8]|uniref:hypothetical protein n=1 Tax=Roseivirga sp. BDSF3-8 TaxID=3241598 RepID=UPI0035327FE3